MKFFKVGALDINCLKLRCVYIIIVKGLIT